MLACFLHNISVNSELANDSKRAYVRSSICIKGSPNFPVFLADLRDMSSVHARIDREVIHLEKSLEKERQYLVCLVSKRSILTLPYFPYPRLTHLLRAVSTNLIFFKCINT